MIHKLSNGIEIKFHDLPELSLEIVNQVTEFCKLCFGRNEFYISTTGKHITSERAKQYAVELILLAAACDEANELLKQHNENRSKK